MPASCFEEPAMSEAAAAWLRLSLAPGVPQEAARAAAAHPEGLPSLLASGPRALVAAGFPDDAARALSGPAPDWLPAALDWLAAPGHDLLTLADPDYPALLKLIPGAPVALFLRGDRALLRRRISPSSAAAIRRRKVLIMLRHSPVTSRNAVS
jgi:DNA processing protein